MWGCVPPPGQSWDEFGHEKTLEMNEFEADKYDIKIWAYKIEKQKR